MFFITICLVFANLLIYLITTIYMTSKIADKSVYMTAKFISSWIVAVVFVFTSWVAIALLVVLHIYLKVINKSTYDWIIDRRKVASA